MDSEFVDTKQTFSQTRRFPRLPTDLPVTVRTDELRVDDRVVDLSVAGAGIRTHRPLSPMSLVSLCLCVPHEPEPIEVLGRVVWATDHSMGVRFEQTDHRLSDVVWRIRQDYERI